MKLYLTIISSLLALSALSEEAKDAEAKEEAPTPTYGCSLTVNPVRGNPRQAGRQMNSNTKTMQGFKNRPTANGNKNEGDDANTFKWDVQVRFRGEGRPSHADVRAYYIGYDGKYPDVTVIGVEDKRVLIDDGGRGDCIVASPPIPKKTMKVATNDRRNNNKAPKKSKVPPMRLHGCIVQVYADGNLVKSWASNTKWKKLAANPKFSERDLPGRRPLAKDVKKDKDVKKAGE